MIVIQMGKQIPHLLRGDEFIIRLTLHSGLHHLFQYIHHKGFAQTSHGLQGTRHVHQLQLLWDLGEKVSQFGLCIQVHYGNHTFIPCMRR